MRWGLLLLAAIVFAVACGEAETAEITLTPAAQPNSAPMGIPAPEPQASVGTIAYVGTDGFLWVRDAGGQRELIYAPENGYVYYPEWSPDGTRIAFTAVEFSEEGASLDFSFADILSVVVVDLNGTELIRVPRAIMPHWSPGGAQLSIGAEPDVDDLEFSMIPSIVDLQTGASRQLLPRTVTLDSPRWSPDGLLLFYAARDGLFLIAPGGESAPRRVVAAEAYELFYLTPVWSGEGSVLVFEADRTSGTPVGGIDSYVAVDPDVGIVNRIGDSNPDKCGRASGFREFEAHWVPGTSLAAWGIECTNSETKPGIWIKEMLGSGEARFIDASSAVRSVGVLDVSADGKFIAFSNAGAGLGTGPGPFSYSGDSGRINIYLVSVEGGDPELLITDALQPAWQPLPLFK